MHRLNGAFFGGVSLDGCFDTPGSFLGCIVGKLLWPECYEFDTQMPKKAIWAFCGFSEFLNKIAIFLSTLKRPNNKFLRRGSQDRYLDTPRNFLEHHTMSYGSHNITHLAHKFPYYIVDIFVLKP